MSDVSFSSEGTESPEKLGVVLVTAASETEAKSIALNLVEAGLAACVNLLPIRSIYRWQGQIQQDEEWQLLIKTDLERFAELEERVRSLHSYEVPEIIALPILAGSPPYLQWIRAQTPKK